VEILIKFICYLDLHGYRIIEFERLSRVQHNFAELIGYGILTGEQASLLLGYKNSWDFYSIFHERRTAGPDKEEGMYKLWKERREELEAKKEKAFDLYRVDIFSRAKQHGETSSLQDNSSKDNSKALQASVAIPLMKALLTVLGEQAPEELSEEDLGSLANEETTILRLSSRLSTISLAVAGTKGDSDG
jgi:hypothetical protein